MSLEEKVQLSLVVIITGLVIVFAMLFFLTYLIRGYGAVIRKMQGDVNTEPVKKAAVSIQKKAPLVEAGIPGEVVAAIAAAVYMTYGNSAGNVTSIRRSVKQPRSAWGMAGLLENTRPF